MRYLLMVVLTLFLVLPAEAETARQVEIRKDAEEIIRVLGLKTDEVENLAKELEKAEKHPIRTVAVMACESVWAGACCSGRAVRYVVLTPARIMKKWIIYWESDYLAGTRQTHAAAALGTELK